MDNQYWRQFKESISFPLTLLIVIWGVHLYFELSGSEKAFYGVFPRELFGARGILTSPLVHGSWAHILSNSAPLLFLSFLLFYFYSRIAVPAFALIYVLTGIAVWLFARPVFHIGASGVVYGLVSFIFWSGIFRKQIRSIILALVVTVLYSGMFLGILPNEDGISWESHLLGACVGIIVAYAYRKKKASRIEWEEQYLRRRSTEEELTTHFFPADIFDKTKQERAEEAFWLKYWAEKDDWTSDNT